MLAARVAVAYVQYLRRSFRSLPWLLAAASLGSAVMAAGFPAGGNLVMSEGQVEGLYLYDGGNVIRTSATFDAGASGGGLFDDEGALVGLLAFKARSGAKLHFALPADWTLSGAAVSSQFVPIVPSGEQHAFWERPKSSQPSFLGLAMLEAASQRDSATSACNQPAGATSSP
ncbi:MAG: trypsin-like peptidase domain-containing protein [Betaproteobacteria bacterium]|nr:MAG: trypsin-like peptidase domain-containing protein [Betaproteobacteria bacterium]